MAWYERHYNQTPTSHPGQWSFTTWLIVLNVAVFLIDAILTGSTRGDPLAPAGWGAFTIQDGVYGGQIWRWITYQFLHAGLLHLVFNMIALYFFGPLLESWWGSPRFLAFYLLCGACGALLFFGLADVPGLINVTPDMPLVGASGSIFGILVGGALVAPRQQVMLFPFPITLHLRTLALIWLAIAALSVLAGSANAGGQAAHLGGAALGFVLIRNPWMLKFADGIAGWGNPVTGAVRKAREASQQSGRRRDQREDAEVDRILNKVKQKGLHSLTRGERKTLERATHRQRGA